MQPKSLSWKQIRDALSDQITSGRLTRGEQLPSEPELSLLFRAGRHSVRRALSALSVDGRVRIVHGRGAFVSDGPAFQYTIDRRERLFDQLERRGHQGEVVTLRTSKQAAGAEVASALGLAEGAAAHVNEVLLVADSIPIGIGRSFHPLAQFPDFAAHRRAAPTQRMFYGSYGIAEFFREDTFLWARPASLEESEILKQHAAMPVVETKTRDVDGSGKVIGYSTTVWAASRIRFVLPAQR